MLSSARQTSASIDEREPLLRVLVVQVFLIFFQGFVVAPLVPKLASGFGVSIAAVSILVPAYMLPYGFVCLLVGPLADRLGQARLLRLLMVAGVLLPAGCATAKTLGALLAWRIASGMFLGGITPVALALIAAVYP